MPLLKRRPFYRFLNRTDESERYIQPGTYILVDGVPIEEAIKRQEQPVPVKVPGENADVR